MTIQRMLSGLAVACVWSAAVLQAQTNLPSEIIAYADVVLYNGKVTTADDAFTIAEAVAIRDGKFLATGPNSKILAMAGPKTVKFDLQGRSALPGFIDTHLHQAWVIEEPPPPGERPIRLRMDTVDGALAELRAIVAKAKPGEFIGLSGPSNKVVAVDLNAALLDQVAPNNPLYIEAANDQVVANSIVMKMLLESYPRVPGVLKDASGKPTGQLRGAASGECVWVLNPWPPIERLIEPQKQSLARLSQMGLTTIMGRASPLTISVLRDMMAAGQLNTRVRIFHEFIRQNAEPERFLKRVGNLTDFGNDLYKIVGTTVQVVDGGGASSAYTSKDKVRVPERSPYGPKGQNKWEETGDMATSDRRNIILANRYGWTIGGMHSSGDESNTLILEAYAEADKERPLAGRHFGMDHGELWKPKHFPLLKQMGITPSLYSKAMYNNEDAAEVFGKDELFKMQPVKSLITAGLKPAAEADANGPAANPLFNMKNWITRIDDKGWQLDPAEKISRQEALYMYTKWAAGYFGEEDKLGSIEPGKLADVIVMAGDYMTYPENDLPKLRVLMTIVGGKVVYQAQGAF